MIESPKRRLAQIITEMTRTLVESQLHAVADAIDCSDDSEAQRRLQSIPRSSSDFERYRKMLIELIVHDRAATFEAAALAIRSSLMTRSDLESIQRLELVWTGPYVDINRNRSTISVLVEMISNARESILIFSYVMILPISIHNALREAITRGVRIDVVLESSEEKSGFNDYSAFIEIKAISSAIGIWKWASSQRTSSRSTMHAKAISVDQNLIFISSANLTNNAVHQNIELGVRIESRTIVRSFREKFEKLIENNVLVRG